MSLNLLHTLGTPHTLKETYKYVKRQLTIYGAQENETEAKLYCALICLP